MLKLNVPRGIETKGKTTTTRINEKKRGRLNGGGKGGVKKAQVCP